MEKSFTAKYSMSLLDHHLSAGKIDQNNVDRQMEESYSGDNGRHSCLSCMSSHSVARGPYSGELPVTLRAETSAERTDKNPETAATTGIT